MNKLREKIGLRQIQADWHLYRIEFGAEDWKKPGDKHLAKRVQRGAKKELLWEEDYYHTGQRYQHEHGWDSERLIIHYDHSKKLIELHYAGTNSDVASKVSEFETPTAKVKEALQTADSVLGAWGMSRL